MGERGLRGALALAFAGILIAAVSAAIGYGLGIGREALAPRPVPTDSRGTALAPPPAAPAPLASAESEELKRLRALLAAEVATREQLEKQLGGLRDDALELDAAYRDELEQWAPGGDPVATLARDSSGNPIGASIRAKGKGRSGADPQPKGVSMGALLAGGFGEVEAEEIRDRIEDITLRQLYLRDTAAREGWENSGRFRQASRGIGGEFDELRDEFGEDRFDWILYATGRENRVVVDNVFGSSAADEVGIQAGDVILSYGDSRIFGGRELRQATTGGRAGELIVLEFERDGTSQRVYVPRGPLGIQLHSATLPPRRPR